MTSTVDHNKIIRDTANSVLKQKGLFQKGTSRVWVDDNGWFLTQIEFQPSGWDSGAYLNVAISFLWRRVMSNEKWLWNSLVYVNSALRT